MSKAGAGVSIAKVFSLDYEGRGVARCNGKTVFIKGALPCERVSYRPVRSKKQFDEAETVAVLQPSAARVRPKCGYFDTCGGCSLQHAAPEAQVAYKQRVLEEQLQRIGKVWPEQLLAPIYGMFWGYRQRARLTVSADKQGRLQLGFQARKSKDVVDINACPVLPDAVSSALPEVKATLQAAVAAGCVVKFVEFLAGDALTVLNVCTQHRPSESALTALHNLSDGLGDGWQIWLQHGREAAYPFYPHVAPPLAYSLPEFGIIMPFRPGDFTQINAQMNALMVHRALAMLDIRPGEQVADLFCGLGNFSLPMAKCGARVLGIEGAEALVQRARQNAQANGCAENTRFQTADLFETDAATVASWGKLDKMLLDPPRSGAYAVVQALHAPYLPQRIVYVSCNPATFARDAAVLVAKGYRFKAAGVMNMFAQTAHVESIAWFERASK
ncbi:23S rRNA (uracil(1939)-C(5))-methyltransferase RlmD [Uruburuella testudinis]|uniref:23S rRNA (uracil(1939)-C(5))-methyltransferase RlmD n=1 Tax=Uruburuella testudinis TaxID=1282863 RepID=A0ABY4DTK7_9NEIS|nr:23S rRNA (uracil(1939)-C(5))-methyltransferase RlmD [Uruburuella testudinis]UOO82223.1 23S rRNA (uracil(1939)-C(5))-methyltransferase RlmD [Uruburuella testudinis]